MVMCKLLVSLIIMWILYYSNIENNNNSIKSWIFFKASSSASLSNSCYFVRVWLHLGNCGYYIRDGWRYQNRWIFGKVPNGLWPPPLLIFGKLCCRFFKTYPENTPFVSFLCQKNPVQKSKICNKNFWIGNDPPPVWNFSKNSSVLVGWSFP